MAAKRKTGRTIMFAVAFTILLAIATLMIAPRINFNKNITPGEVIDSLDGVYVFYNGGVGQQHGRNLGADGYNIGLRWQCVEFIKRYYYEHYGHRMPDAYGNAKDFFDFSIGDGQYSPRRGLIQYRNCNKGRPRKGDIIVFGPSTFNRYGHVAIISEIGNDYVEIIQQNPGPWGSSREKFQLNNVDGEWDICNRRIMGWLRLEEGITQQIENDSVI